MLALESLRAGGPSTSFNLGNGKPVSVRELIDCVARVTGRKVPVTEAARRPGDPAVLYASSDKIKRELGWTPRFEQLDVIVETAYRWREKNPHGYGEGRTSQPVPPKLRSSEGG
jgi:UDP-glucose 4-epimerase